ncbi:MAG TPA: UDP-3-O-(3-hydroxymyristoyl)glucosamine N-acyltransferase [Rhizomicrobium sp.]
MADPRFYGNRGPFTLAEVCAQALVAVPDGADPERRIADLATLEGAGADHLSFCLPANRAQLSRTRAGYCFIEQAVEHETGTFAPRFITCGSVLHAFAAAARLFYPAHELEEWSQESAIHPAAMLEEGVRLAPGVIIGPDAEIGARTKIGPCAVIGRGVRIGRDCEIGSHAGICFTLIGDGVQVFPGAQIGQPGFGFASSATGHAKIPQLGRVIVQDKVEIGACTTIDRGALGDTVIGEGSKIDNLVQIGHNSRLGRHCVIVAQAGISGSCELGDFVVLGGQVGISDHVRMGDHARLAARGAAITGDYPGHADYGGSPARPIREWRREVAAVALLAKRRGRKRDG